MAKKDNPPSILSFFKAVAKMIFGALGIVYFFGALSLLLLRSNTTWETLAFIFVGVFSLLIFFIAAGVYSKPLYLFVPLVFALSGIVGFKFFEHANIIYIIIFMAFTTFFIFHLIKKYYENQNEICEE